MRYFIMNRCAATIDGTIGRMGSWFTFEEEDQENRRNVSSIPPGAYVCKRVQSPTFGDTFEVTGVPGRSGILFHALNTEEDTRGCIGLGTEVGFMYRDDEDTGERTRKLAVMNSRVALSSFKAELAGVDEFILVIEELY